MKTSWDIVKDGTARGIDVNAKAVVFRTGAPPYESSHSCTHAQFLGGHMQDHLIATFGSAVVADVIAAVLSFHPLAQTDSKAARLRKALNQGLDRAIWNGELDSLNLLIQAGADPNQKGRYGITPLMSACSSSHPNKYAIMKLLLQHGADPNEALDRAIAQGELDSLNLLIQAGADINRKGSYYGMTPLMNAFSSPNPNKYEIMKLLLQHGADPNATDDGGDNLLMRVLSGYSGTRERQEQERENGAPAGLLVGTLKFGSAPDSKGRQYPRS
jgi:ankyrin repeat protein